MDWTTTVFLVCVAAFTALAAGFDLRTKKLPNRLTVPALVAAFVFHGATSGSSGQLTALAGFATGFGILLVLWIVGGGGGGDVKLMGALGAWLGPQGTLAVFLISAALGRAIGRRTAGLANGRSWNQLCPTSLLEPNFRSPIVR